MTAQCPILLRFIASPGLRRPPKLPDRGILLPNLPVLGRHFLHPGGFLFRIIPRSIGVAAALFSAEADSDA